MACREGPAYCEQFNLRGLHSSFVETTVLRPPSHALAGAGTPPLRPIPTTGTPSSSGRGPTLSLGVHAHASAFGSLLASDSAQAPALPERAPGVTRGSDRSLRIERVAG